MPGPGYVLAVGDGELNATLLDADRALWRGDPPAEFAVGDLDPDGRLDALRRDPLVLVEGPI